jgi:hypothetical protein
VRLNISHRAGVPQAVAHKERCQLNSARRSCVTKSTRGGVFGTLELGFAGTPLRGFIRSNPILPHRATVVVFMEDDGMDTRFRMTMCRWTYAAVIASTINVGSLAFSQDVSFDFARLVEYRDVTPPEWLARTPRERLVEMKLPISVRFQGLVSGEIEHLDFEIDGTAAGIRVEGFSPTTLLAADAVTVETTTKTTRERSLGAKLSGTLPVPIGPVTAEIGPGISAGISKADEATEKVRRLPPKRPIVVSGTFAEGQGVFFKFKQSSQTTFEGVHVLEVTFAVPADWDGRGVRISCTARGNKPLLWMDKPAVFGHADDAIEFYSAGEAKPRNAAATSPVEQASFFQSAAEGIKHAAKQAIAECPL